MPQTPHGKRMQERLRKKYGKKRGDQVYWGMITKGKIKGAEPKSKESQLRRRYKRKQLKQTIQNIRQKRKR